MIMKFVLLFLTLAIAAHSQQQMRVAIISTVDNENSLKYNELDFLTGKLREIAGNVLPSDRYGIMTQESIVDRMGSQERAEKECRAATCLADLGRKISADYIAQCRIGRFSGMLTIKVELYNSKSGNLVGTFNETSKSLFNLTTILDNKAPNLFMKILEENKIAPSANGETNDADVYFVRGYEYYGEGDYDKAIYNLSEAIRLNSKFQLAYSLRGNAYVEKRDYNKAVSDLSEAIRLNPNPIEDDYGYRGYAYLMKGDYDNAISDYTKAIQLNLNSVIAYNNRCLAYSMKGDYDRAIADCKSALRIDPNNANAKKVIEEIGGNSSISKGVFTDSRDGKTYKTIKIGNQTWMADNLNYNASGSQCYNNNSVNCGNYGRLYNWSTARKVCPSGWHLPSKSEYEILDKAVGGENVAGKKLKSKSGWYKNGNGTDQYGFSAFPCGFGDSVGNFYDFGDVGNWWSANEYNSSKAYGRYMSYYDSVNWGDGAKILLFSVRCVKD